MATQKSVQSKIEELLNQMASSGMAGFIFAKAGKTRVRLSVDSAGEISAPVATEYQGKKKTKYLFLGFDPSSEKPEWKGVLVPRTVARAILNLATEFPLFAPEGHGVIITRTGEGLSSTYSVTPSKGIVAIPEELGDPPTLASLVHAYENQKSASETAVSGESDWEE